MPLIEYLHLIVIWLTWRADYKFFGSFFDTNKQMMKALSEFHIKCLSQVEIEIALESDVSWNINVIS